MNASLALSPADYKAVKHEMHRRKFSYFVKDAWHVLEPATQLKWGWALDAMCEHLEAVSYQQIFNLLMNVPPGTMKSLLTSVFWPAWEWGPLGMPHQRYLGTAHKETLAIRDSLRCRRLIKSEWYTSLYPISLLPDQDNKTKFENEQTGFREAMAFSSMTGSRGSRVLLDDPLSVDDARSPVELENAALTFTEALPTRRSDDKSAVVVIMQRLDERDTSGVILSNDLGYTHLMLPMEFEPERKCYTSIGFEDPRTEEGELLMPERFPPAEVEFLKKNLSSEGGSYAVAGQFQQRPVPRGGGLFKREWFKFIQPEDLPKMKKTIRGWDLAATGEEEKKRVRRAAYTAGALVGLTEEDDVVIIDMIRTKKSPGGVKKLIVDTAESDGIRVRGSVPQDPGQAGKAQVNDFAKMLQRWDYHFSPETGSKYSRALPIAAQAEIGNVYLVEGPWNKEFLLEIEQFPKGATRDQVDALSRAYSELVKPSARARMFVKKGNK